MRRTVVVAGTVALAVVGVAAVKRFYHAPLPHTAIAARVTYIGGQHLDAVEDWPQWRGPRADGISREPLPTTLPSSPKRLWSAEVGLGFSSPVAAAGRLYLFSMNEGRETLTAFDASTGQILWNAAGEEGFTRSVPGTRATPVIDADRIYTYGGNGELVCRNLADGQTRWSINILDQTGASPLEWGQSSCPLVDANSVYVQGGKGGSIAVAIDKFTGGIRWRSQATGQGGYAAPVLANGRLIIFAADAVFALDPATGQTVWSHPWKTPFGVNAAPPLVDGDRLFITSEYNTGCAMLDLSVTPPRVLWQNKEVMSKFQAPILDRGALYANNTGTLVCIDWSTGELRWKATQPELRLGAGGSILRSGDQLLLLSERGKLSLLHTTDNGFELKGQAKLFEGNDNWATPLLYGGRLYAKGPQELVCFDLTSGD